MPCSLDEDGGVWALLGPEHLTNALAPLARRHLAHRAVRVLRGGPERIDAVARGLGSRAARLVVVEDPQRPSARPHFDGPLLVRAAGPDVTLGWLRLPGTDLARYARCACSLLARKADDPAGQPMVLLGPRERRYLDLLDELQAAAGGAEDGPGGAGRMALFRWSAERVRPVPMLRGLHYGVAVALYAGHGVPGGWWAYGGLAAGHFAASGAWGHDQAAAAVFALSCGTAALDAAGASLADRLVGLGAAGAVVAATGDVSHRQNRALALALMRASVQRVRGLDELLWRAREAGGCLRGYAVIGDPGLPVLAARGAAERCRRLFAPAADFDLRDCQRLKAQPPAGHC